jgi:hypothetical protein
VSNRINSVAHNDRFVSHARQLMEYYRNPYNPKAKMTTVP